MPASHSSLALLALKNPLDGVDFGGGLTLIALAALAWLLTYALHSSLLLGSAWLATRRISDARAGLRERVWKFALLAAFVTASVQVGLGFEPLGGRLSLQSPGAHAPRAPSAILPAPGPTHVALARNEFLKEPGQAQPWSVLLAKQAMDKIDLGADFALQSLFQLQASPALAGRTVEAEPQVGASESSDLLASRPLATPWHASLGAWTQWAFATCLLGALGGLCLFGLLWLRLSNCLRDRIELEHGVLFNRLQDLRSRAGIRRLVRLSVAPSLGAPISMGMFRSEICVPPRVLLELSEEEQEALLAHELAHVVRRDPLWLALCRLCENVCFFQPMNRVARREIEDCAEFLSDAWAVRHTGLRFSLASCLTRIAEWIVGDRRSLPAPAMAHGRSRLRHRIELLLDETSAERVDRSPRWLGAACTGFCATLVAVVPCVSAREDVGRKGDGAGLAFLPERDSLGESVPCDKEPEAEKAKNSGQNCEEAAGVATVVETPAAAAGSAATELGSELDGLAEEIALLRGEVATLDLKAEFARDVARELKLLEMKLVHLRELNSRLDLLRVSLQSRVLPPPELRRDARSTAPANLQPVTNASTPSANLEESSK